MADIAPHGKTGADDEKVQSLQSESIKESLEISPSPQFNNVQKSWEKPGTWGTVCRSWRTTQRYIWDDPDKPSEEKKFLFKLDIFLLSYTCLGYFCKGLDQGNINSAYVSGMKESLNMNGSQLTYMSNVFTAGYVIGQIPAVVAVTRIRPSILVSSCEILWSVFTFCCAAVKTTPQLYAMRFLVGLCEGVYFPVIVYLIGSWYTKTERGKRVTLFYASATISFMFSSYLQAGAYRNLAGHLGHQGWQWLFIVCGIISLPIGVIGYFFNPDFPENTRAFYISAPEAEFARKRIALAGYKPLGASAWTKTKIFSIIRTWQFWILPLGYSFIQASFPSQQPVFSLWLKSTGHSVYKINVLPTAQYGIGTLVLIIAGMISDSPLLLGRRWQAISVLQGVTVFASIVLAVWTVPINLKYLAYYVLWFASGVPGVYWAWYPDLIPHDHEMRGFVIAVTNIFSYIMQIWYSDAVWRTIESPKFRPGFIAASCFGICTMAMSLGVHLLEMRDVKRRRNQAYLATPAQHHSVDQVID
ncbi:hypothetical protein B7494_g3236 [Chlorociboria aeruginascens]|nr:hypothetical protein B7494_g3236 [Chlorociboria aeruginascens]